MTRVLFVALLMFSGAVEAQTSVEPRTIEIEFEHAVPGWDWSRVQSSFLDFEKSTKLDIGEETWIEPDLLRFTLESVWVLLGPETTEQVFARLLGARVTRGLDKLQVDFFINGGLVLALKDRQQAKNWEVYRLELPEVLRLDLDSPQEGQIRISARPRSLTGWDTLRLLLKMAYFPDRIYFRKLDLDMETGYVRAQLGAGANALTVIASGNLFTRHFDGIDWSDTARRNWWILLPVIW